MLNIFYIMYNQKYIGESNKMSYKTNRLILSLIAWIATLVIYLFCATGSSAPADADLAGWAQLMLKFIIFGIIVQVIIQVLFHVAIAISLGIENGFEDEEKLENIIERTIKSSTKEDEMDKLIDMKAGLFGLAIIGIGIMLALASVAYFDYTAVNMMNIIFLSALVSVSAVTCASIYYYQKGV